MRKSAFLKDNNGNIMQAIIDIEGDIIKIRMFDEQYNLLGYMNFQIQDNNRIFLFEVYCYDEHRGNGIGTKLSELADYVLKDYEGYIIRGVYSPTQMSTDRDKYSRSFEELEKRARLFYEKNGYEILEHTKFEICKDKYEFLNEKEDFTINGRLINEIVFKVINDKEYNYYEDNGLIFNIEKGRKK